VRGTLLTAEFKLPEEEQAGKDCGRTLYSASICVRSHIIKAALRKKKEVKRCNERNLIRKCGRETALRSVYRRGKRPANQTKTPS
jgi:hypothetical protein